MHLPRIRNPLAVLGVTLGCVAVPSGSSAAIVNSWMFAAQPLPESQSIITGMVPESDSGGFSPELWYTFMVDGSHRITYDEGSGFDRDASQCRASLVTSTGEAVTSPYTTPSGVNRLFFKLTHCPTDRPFRFDFNAPGRVDTPPMPTALPTSEPNENPGLAAGPLIDSVWYSGSIDTDNDEDWFHFYVAAGTTQVTLTVNNAGEASGIAANIQIFSASDLDRKIIEQRTGQNDVDSVTVSLNGPALYYVKITSGGYLARFPAPWWFAVSGGIVPKPTPTPKAVTCRITSSKIKKGASARGTCTGMKAGTKLTAKWYRYTSRSKHAKLTRTLRAKVRGSRAFISSKKLVRGLYRLTLVHNGKSISSRQVGIR